MHAIQRLVSRLTPLLAKAANDEQVRPALQAGGQHLSKDQLIHVPGAAGWSLRALSGSVWITIDGELRDVVLEAGESFVFDHAGAALVSPLQESDLCFANDFAGQRDCSATAAPKTAPKASKAMPLASPVAA